MTKRHRITIQTIERITANAVTLLEKLMATFEETMTWPVDALRAARTIAAQIEACKSLDWTPAAVTAAARDWGWVLDWEAA
jgi:hypothetical protein